MRIPCSLLLAAAAALGLVGAGAADDLPNLVTNGSFEAGGDRPNGWEVFQPAGSVIRRDTTVVHFGQACVQITSDATGAKEYPNIKFALAPVERGEEYLGTGWVRTRRVTDLGGYLVLELDRAGERVSFVSSAFTMGGDHDWMRLEVRATVPPNVDGLKLGAVAHGEGEVWFDDLCLQRVHALPPDPLIGDRVLLRIATDQPTGQPFYGFGSQGDAFLTCAFSRAHGVTPADVALVEQRVSTMRPHIIRTFVAHQWWEPEEGNPAWTDPRFTGGPPGTGEDPYDRFGDYVRWLHFLKRLGAEVLVTPWGDNFAYPAWMGPDPRRRLPAPGKEEAMVRGLVDLLWYLRHDQGLTNVRYVSLMNEPDNDPLRAPAAERYDQLSRRLDQLLRERGLRRQVTLLAADEASGNQSGPAAWYEQLTRRGVEYADAWSCHTYTHEYVPPLADWIATRRRSLPPHMPVCVTECGYGGDTYDNWANGQYEYGLFLGEFAITALRAGASMALQWCLFDAWYSDTSQQHWGLWQGKDQNWAPRPGFYAWSLLTRHTRPDSEVFPVQATPAARELQAIALRDPRGRFTVIALSRYSYPLTVQLALPGGEGRTLSRYVYSRETAHGDAMIPASGTGHLDRRGRGKVRVPGEAMVVLTEIE